MHENEYHVGFPPDSGPGSGKSGFLAREAILGGISMDLSRILQFPPDPDPLPRLRPHPNPLNRGRGSFLILWFEAISRLLHGEMGIWNVFTHKRNSFMVKSP